MAGTIVQEIPLYGFNMPLNGRKSAGVRVVKSLRTQVNFKSKKPLLIAPLFLLLFSIIRYSVYSYTPVFLHFFGVFVSPFYPPPPLITLSSTSSSSSSYNPPQHTLQGVDPTVVSVLDAVHTSLLQDEILKARNRSSLAAKSEAQRTAKVPYGHF
jgi:hypothetical protein